MDGPFIAVLSAEEEEAEGGFGGSVIVDQDRAA